VDLKMTPTFCFDHKKAPDYSIQNWDLMDQSRMSKAEIRWTMNHSITRSRKFGEINFEEADHPANAHSAGPSTTVINLKRSFGASD